MRPFPSILCSLVILCTTGFGCPPARAAAPARPNVIVVLTDDEYQATPQRVHKTAGFPLFCRR